MPDPSLFPGPPDTPKILNTTKSSVTLSWNVPTVQGASSIIGYTVEYFSSDLQTGWVVTAHRIISNSITVNDLKPDTSYMFIVRAENSHGLGAPSKVSQITRTLGLNTLVPQHLLDEARGRLGTKVVNLKELIPTASTAVRITWELQILNGREWVEGVYVRFRDLSGGSQKYNMATVMNADATSYTVSNLKKYTKYEFFLVPFFKSVEGQPSNSMVVQTLEDVPSAPPDDMQAGMLNMTSAFVKWAPPPPQHFNGNLLGYKIQVKAFNSTKILAQMTLNASTTSVLLNNLTSGAVYTARVVAYTRAGLGPYSSPLTLVMDPHAPPHALPNDNHHETWLVIAIVIFGSSVIFGLGAILYVKKRSNTGKDCGHLSVPVVTANDLSQLSMLNGSGKETLWIDRGWRGEKDTETKLLSGRITECSDYAEVDTRNLSTFHHPHRKNYNPTPYATTTLINGGQVEMTQPMFGASSSSETKTLSSNGSSRGNDQNENIMGPVYLEDSNLGRGNNATPHWSEFIPPPPQHPPPQRYNLNQQDRGSEPRLLTQGGSITCGSPQMSRRAMSTTSSSSAPHRTAWHNYVPPPMEHPPPVPRISEFPRVCSNSNLRNNNYNNNHITHQTTVPSEYDYESASLLYKPLHQHDNPSAERSTQSTLPHKKINSGNHQDWNHEDNRSCSGSDTCCSCSESSCLYADPTHQVTVNYSHDREPSSIC